MAPDTNRSWQGDSKISSFRLLEQGQGATASRNSWKRPISQTENGYENRTEDLECGSNQG